MMNTLNNRHLSIDREIPNPFQVTSMHGTRLSVVQVEANHKKS